MHIFTRVLAISGLTGALAALAFAAPATATTADRIKGACLAGGEAKTAPAVPFVGGSGAYTFTGELTCVDIEISKGGAIALYLVMMDVTSPGKWTNIVCGTGKAVSDPNSIVVISFRVQAILGTPKTNTTTEWQTVADDLDYVVEFIVFNGLLKWTDDEAQKLSEDVPKLGSLLGDPFVSGPGGNPGGYVLIFPFTQKGAVLPNACTKAFQVVAALAIDWSPDNSIL